MFKNEKILIITIPTLLSCGAIYVTGVSPLTYLFLVFIPLFLMMFNHITSVSDSRFRVNLAISTCLEESDFNVIDKIESLRLYFTDTHDVISYLSIVDSRILTYVFNPKNRELLYKDFIKGAVSCITIFKEYHGHCFFDIDIDTIPESERITTLLSTLYMVSKEMDKGVNNIYISSSKKDGRIIIDVCHERILSHNDDPFCDKLLSIFSTNEFTFSHSVAS